MLFTMSCWFCKARPSSSPEIASFFTLQKRESRVILEYAEQVCVDVSCIQTNTGCSETFDDTPRRMWEKILLDDVCLPKNRNERMLDYCCPKANKTHGGQIRNYGSFFQLRHWPARVTRLGIIFILLWRLVQYPSFALQTRTKGEFSLSQHENRLGAHTQTY